MKVALQVSGDADLRASPDLVRFTPENWDRPRQVTLSAGEDDDPDDGSAQVAHVVTSPKFPPGFIVGSDPSD